MKFFVWLFFLLIGGVNVWAAGPKILREFGMRKYL